MSTALVPFTAPDPARMTLADYLRHEYLPPRDISKKAAYQLEISVRKFDAWLGRPTLLGDLSDKLVNAWMDSILAEGRSIYRADYFTACILVAWDTGLRLSDLRTVKRTNMGPDGVLPLVQHKSNGLVFCQLRPETIEACQKLWACVPVTDERLLPFPAEDRQFFWYFRLLVQKAGIPPGSIKRVRKSAATAVETAMSGAATSFLGHTSPELARRHYVDPRLVPHNRPMPPALEGGTT